MVSLKKIEAALPYLNTRELSLLEKDAHRAADAAAIGGASERQWHRYVDIESAFSKELKARMVKSECPDFSTECSAKEREELKAAWQKIVKGKFNSCVNFREKGVVNVKPKKKFLRKCDLTRDQLIEILGEIETRMFGIAIRINNSIPIETKSPDQNGIGYDYKNDHEKAVSSAYETLWYLTALDIHNNREAADDAICLLRDPLKTQDAFLHEGEQN